MTTLYDYLQGADESKKAILRKQWNDATSQGCIYCPCGKIRSLTLAYKCLYCGVWFCSNCAEAHFGMTMKEWLEAERNQGRSKVHDIRKSHH